MLEKQQFAHVGADVAFEIYQKDSVFAGDVETVYKTMEYSMKLPDLLGKTIAVNERQFGEVYQILKKQSEAAQIELPKMYVFEDFFYGMESYGMGPYWIEVSAKTIRDFNKTELNFLIAREIYKIKYKITYQKMFLEQVQKVYAATPKLGETIKNISMVSFNHWYRLENYSADNYGYLCTGTLKPCVEAMAAMVLNSKSMLEQLDLRAFIKQGSEINKLDDTVSRYTKSDEVQPYVPFRIESILSYAISKRGVQARKAVSECSY